MTKMSKSTFPFINFWIDNLRFEIANLTKTAIEGGYKFTDGEVIITTDLDHKPHSFDGPSFINVSSEKYKVKEIWSNVGRAHREDGPAVTYTNGRQVWYYANKMHNDNDAAIVDPAASLEAWYKHGVLHREDGPAFVVSSQEIWYRDGKMHRADGAAWTNNGIKSFYLDGLPVSAEFKKWAKENKAGHSDQDFSEFVFFRFLKS